MKDVRMALQKCSMRVSMIRGGSGALQFDLMRSLWLVVDGSKEVSSSSVPAKKIERPMSRSNRERVLSISSCVMLSRGVGMYFSPSPRRELAVGGSVPFVVRSWNARLFTFGK